MSQTPAPPTPAPVPAPAPVTGPVSLRGRTIVVTGANTGIGAAIAKLAGATGMNVVIDYVAHPELNQPLIDEIVAAGGQAIAVQADVTRVEHLQSLVDAAVDAYGRLDVWVNNAGVETRLSLLEDTEEKYDFVMDINMKGAYFGAQVAAKRFIAQGSRGVIVNVSSVHEDWPMPGNTAYCVAKGGLRMFAKNVGVELADHGIRVVNVAPGAISTPINKETEADPGKIKQLNESIPAGRIGQPSEVASVVLFVASDEASYMTATTVTVDGGITQGAAGL
ncbi:glucose 1-dehydrogenase [Raineyella antarctica]|uniref:Glucose 1-dehydrogenase n=1 Tax=Raineyella antarctica TaxID=1577474 RepID=A0A1G6HF41_9ACTN|nr:glucose 1-dehydrogenase [Raineyella antarctica]SDB92565.1 glucose 1-dehydrogenase [Raineyella antarctica]